VYFHYNCRPLIQKIAVDFVPYIQKSGFYHNYYHAMQLKNQLWLQLPSSIDSLNFVSLVTECRSIKRYLSIDINRQACAKTHFRLSQPALYYQPAI